MFAGEVNKLRAEKIKPKEQLTLEPYERDHAIVVGQYRLAILMLTITSSLHTHPLMKFPLFQTSSQEVIA